MPEFRKPELDPNAMPHVVERTIDQAVADGRVDGMGRRIGSHMLLGMAFDGLEISKATMHKFWDNVVIEPRFLDMDEDQMYAFIPVLSPGSSVRSSLRSIVDGTARCSDEEYQEAIMLMETMKGVIYAASQPGKILSEKQIKVILSRAGYDSTEQRVSIFRYLAKSEDFIVPGDGRYIVAEHFRGSAKDLEELPFISDLGDVVEQILGDISTDHQGIFAKGVALGTLRAHDIYLRWDQVNQFFKTLADHPDVQPLPDGRFRYTKPEVTDTTSQREADRSLDKMIAQAFPPNQRGHRSGKRRK